jgi:hypothetical protein
MTLGGSFRKGWGVYLVAYVGLFLVLLYPYFRYAVHFGFVSVVSILIEALAIYVLYRHVFFKPLPSTVARVAAIGIAGIFSMRMLFVGFLLVSNLFPWTGSGEQWISMTGLASGSFQLPMAFALYLYALGTQRARATEATA